MHLTNNDLGMMSRNGIRKIDSDQVGGVNGVAPHAYRVPPIIEYYWF
jgi:hypothetical protein